MADDPPSASSLLHLLAAASSDLPPGTQRISASYHLHELPANPAAASSTTPAVAGAAAGPSTGSVDASPSNARKRKADSLAPPEGPSGAGAAAGAREDTPGTTTTTGAEAGSSSAADQAKKVVKNGNNKVTLSCAECRRLKLKCDRVWPCSNCKKRGVATICPSGELKGGKGKRLILANTEELHARISALESALHESHAQLVAARSSGGSGGAQEGGEKGAGGAAAGGGVGGTAAGHPLLESSFHYEPLDGEASVSAAKEREREREEKERGVGEENIGRLSAGRFFGGSAGSAYLLSENQSPSPSAPETPYGSSHPSPQYGLASTASSSVLPSGGMGGGSNGLSTPSAAATMEMLVAQLPSREQAWALSDSYFRNGSWMYCVIKRRMFDNDFFPLAYSSTTSFSTPQIPPHKLALFFMILCLGALFDLNSAPYNQLSKRYYALAKASLAVDSTGSVVSVQTVMLMGTYLLNEHSHATSGGEEFWPLLGLAMKHAVALGLHRDGQNWNLPKEEVDERRRVFFELDTYETLQALCLGRPRSLATQAIDTKVPGSNSEEDMKSESIFHQAKYRLLSLMKRVNDLQTKTTPCTYDQIITLDQEFRAFERQLPAELHCSEDSCVLPTDGNGWIDKTFILQRHAMLIMINESLLFLHRGWFARALRDFPDEPLKARWSRSYIAELESCKTIISVVRDVLQLQGSLVTRHWFFFFHAFSASTSLAVSVIRAPSSSLALSAFQELEAGVALFESARIGSRPRDELPILKKLRDRAAEKLVLHRSKKSKKALKQAVPNDGLTDDLDLIGDDSHRRQSSSLANNNNNASSSSAAGPNAMSRSTQNFPPAGQMSFPTLATQLPSNTSAPNPSALAQMSFQHQHQQQFSGTSSPSAQDLAQIGSDGTGNAGFFFPTTLDEAIAAQPHFPTDFNEFSHWASDPNFGMGASANGGTFGYGEPERLGMFQANGAAVDDFDFETFLQGIGIAQNDSNVAFHQS